MISKHYSWDHSGFFQRMRCKIQPFTLLSSKDTTALTFDWSTVLWLVVRNVEGQNLHRLWHVEVYGSTGCWVFKQGIQNQKDFCLKISIPKENSWILRIGVMASCQNLSIILVITWFKEWCYQKISIKKNVRLNWYSSMKKNWERFLWFFT